MDTASRRMVAVQPAGAGPYLLIHGSREHVNDDRVLVEAVLANAPGAFARLVREYQGLCWHIVQRMVRHPDDTRELCYAQIVRAAAHEPGVDLPADFAERMAAKACARTKAAQAPTWVETGLIALLFAVLVTAAGALLALTGRLDAVLRPAARVGRLRGLVAVAGAVYSPSSSKRRCFTLRP